MAPPKFQHLPDNVFSKIASYMTPQSANRTITAFGDAIRPMQRFALIRSIVRPPPEAPRVTIRKRLNG